MAVTRNDLSDASLWDWTADRTGIPRDMEQRFSAVIPQDALSDGWQINADDGQDVTRDLDAALHLEARLEEAATLARRGVGDHGGAWLWVVVRGLDTYADPLPDGPHDVAAVHVLTLDDVQPLAWEHSPESPGLALPSVYRVHLARGGVSLPATRVHASHLVYVPSGFAKRPRDRTANGSRCWSVRYLYERAAADVDKGFASSARLLDRRSVPHVHIQDPRPRSSTETSTRGVITSARVQSYLRRFLAKLTGDGLAVTFGEDTFSFTAPAVSGTPELLTALAWRLCMVEGLTLTWLFGQTPGGLSTDDKAGDRARKAVLQRVRKDIYSAVLLAVHRITLGPGHRWVDWPTLDEPTPLEDAQASFVRAQRDLVLVQGGMIDAQEARDRHADGKEVLELRLLADEAPEPEPAAPPAWPFGAPDAPPS